MPISYHADRQVGVGPPGDADDARNRRQTAAEVHTPNLDRLVKEGIGEWSERAHGGGGGRLCCSIPCMHGLLLNALLFHRLEIDRHYAYRVCGPSRAALQSGRLATHVNFGNKMLFLSFPLVVCDVTNPFFPPRTCLSLRQENTGVSSANPEDPWSGFAGIPRNMTTISRKLKRVGYVTAITGKWDSGIAHIEQTPWGRGYDEFYGFFGHANDYWAKSASITSVGEIENCLNAPLDFARRFSCLFSPEPEPEPEP
jgi:arylsulfatase A-like enzyme